MAIEEVTLLKTFGGRVDWAPDGELIAFDAKGSEGFYDVWVMRPDGTGERCLTCGRPEFEDRHSGNPAWHPDSEWLVFQGEQHDHPGGSLPALPGFGRFSDLWLMSRDGTRFYNLTRLPVSRDSGVLHAHFSPDGQRLSWSEMYRRPSLLTSKRRAGYWRLKVADFEHSAEGQWLANVRAFEPGGPGFYENHGFSPAGDTLLFTSNFPGGGLFRDTRIFLFDLSRETTLMLTDNASWNEHATFTPDGRHIVWGTSFDNPNRGMDWWVMKADGSDQRRLSQFNDPTADGYAGFSLAVDHSWSPDGRRFVGYVQESLIRQSGRIVMVRVSGRWAPERADDFPVVLYSTKGKESTRAGPLRCSKPQLDLPHGTERTDQ